MSTTLTSTSSAVDDARDASSAVSVAVEAGGPEPDAEGGEVSVSAIIVNYNAGDYLGRTVQSLLAQSLPPCEIIIIDNGSSDGGLDLVRAHNGDDGPVAIHEMGRNTGFAQGCNEGLARARGNLLLFVNPDCVLEAGAVAAMAGELTRDARAGMVGPLICNPDGSEQRGCRRDIPTPWQVACVLMGLHRLMPDHPRFRHFNHVGMPVPAEPVEVQALSGACMLVRRAALDKVGVFDSGFFLHFEDVDLCMRFAAAGYRIVFTPGAAATHEKGVSSRRHPIRAEWHKHLSFLRFLNKHFTRFYPAVFMLALGAMIYAHFGFQVARRLVRGGRAPATTWDRIVEGQDPRQG